MWSEREGGGWGKKILAGAGALGAYEWWKHKRDQKRERREERDYGDESVFDDDGHDRRYRGPPTGMASSAGPEMGPSMGPSGVSSQASTRPPPGVMYGAGSVPTGVESRAPPHRPRRAQLLAALLQLAADVFRRGVNPSKAPIKSSVLLWLRENNMF